MFTMTITFLYTAYLLFGPPSSSSEESFFIARQKWTPSSKSAKEAFEENIAIAKETLLSCYWTGKDIKIHIMLRDCHAYCPTEHRLSSEVLAFLQLPVCKRIACIMYLSRMSCLLSKELEASEAEDFWQTNSTLLTSFIHFVPPV